MSDETLRCARAIYRVGGAMVRIYSENGADVRVPFTGSVQPRPSEAGQWSDPLGVGQDSFYTLYVPYGGAGGPLEPGDTVEFRGHRYQVVRGETYCLSGSPMYDWAVLKKEGRWE